MGLPNGYVLGQEVARSGWASATAEARSTKLDEFKEIFGNASAHDYVEKIFQVPFWLKPMTPDASRRLVKGLLKGSVQKEATQEKKEEKKSDKAADRAPPKEGAGRTAGADNDTDSMARRTLKGQSRRTRRGVKSNSWRSTPVRRGSPPPSSRLCANSPPASKLRDRTP